MSFYLLIFRVFAKDVLLNAKIFSICFVAKFFILAFIKTPSAKTQKNVNKLGPLQMSRSSTSCVLCFVSFYLLFFCVFAEGVFINAKMKNFATKH